MQEKRGIFMIRKASECKVEARENMRGGDGVVKITNFVTKEELNEKGRLFANITLEPNCGIGYHVHENDCEIFYVQKGTAEYNDNGTVVTVSAGDVLITPAGTGHSIANHSDENVELIAVIVYA